MFRPLFVKTLNTLQPDPARTESLWRELEAAYSAPQRRYHTLAHLDALAEVMAPLWQQAGDKEVLVLAIAYHDAVYDPERGDNEERSADLAAARVGPLLPAARSERLRRHILGTRAHGATADPDTDLFTDADLSILGASPDAYDQYARAVREEYHIYPDAVYRPGRAGVLRKFLTAGRLFKTEYFTIRLEAPARANLQRELAELCGTGMSE